MEFHGPSYGLAEGFQGLNDSDSVSALRGPPGHSNTCGYARGHGNRGSRGKDGHSNFSRFKHTTRREYTPDSTSRNADHGTTQCYNCKMHGHFKGECRELGRLLGTQAAAGLRDDIGQGID